MLKLHITTLPMGIMTSFSVSTMIANEMAWLRRTCIVTDCRTSRQYF